jgi:hypothetical protein
VLFSCRTRSGTQSSTRFGVLGWGLRFRRHNVAHGYSKNRCVVNARFGVPYHSDPRRPYPFRFPALQSLPLPPVWQCHPLPIGQAAEIQYGGAGGGRAAVGEADEVLMVDIPRFNDSRSTVPNIYVSRQELWMNVYRQTFILPRFLANPDIPFYGFTLRDATRTPHIPRHDPSSRSHCNMRSQWLDHDTSILFKEPALADAFKTAANTEICTSLVATAVCPLFIFRCHQGMERVTKQRS